MPQKRAKRSSVCRRFGFRPCSFEALEDRRLLSLTPEMVADLRVLPASSNPDSFFPVGDAMYFTAETAEHGRELWISDGTAAGTHLVADLAPGPASSNPSELVEFQGAVYFTARESDGGDFNLYRTDGASAATTRVFVDATYQAIRNIAVANDRLFFFCRTSLGHTAFASTNGSADDVIRLSYELSDYARLYSLGNKLIVIDHNVYVSDGTVDGTFRLQGVRALPPMAVLNGVGLFFRDEASRQYELWKTDGTLEGTVLVKDIRPGPDGSISTTFPTIKELDGVAYFSANDGVHGDEPFRSDGTAEGTFALREIADGFDGSFFGPAGVLGDILFYSCNEPDARALYALRDGQLDRLVGFPKNAQVAFASVSDQFYFIVDAVSDDTFWTLWKSDGTTEGTLQVTTIPNVQSVYPPAVKVIGNQVWFAAEDAVHGRELWTSDGTAEGTQLLHDVSIGTGGADPRTLKSVGDNLFFQFRAPPGDYSNDLWVLPHDGAPRQLTDGLFADPIVEQMPLVEYRGGVAFGRSTGFSGIQGVWRSDGTVEGTRGIGLSVQFEAPYMMTEVEGDVFFSTPWQLWKVDSETDETFVVKDLPLPGMSFDDYRYDRPVSAGGLLYFSTQGSSVEIWRSDGTPSGTFSLGPMSGDRRPIRALDDKAFFLRSVPGPVPVQRKQLFVSNGTLAGTRQITLPAADPLSLLGSAGGKFYFTASSAAHGFELWATDGSDAGTHMVADITPNGSSKFGAYTAFGDQFVFVVDDGTHGMELWITDGTSEGTRMLDDTIPGTGGFVPKHLTSVSGAIFFTANDGVHGRELWRISPTRPAEMIADIWPGAISAMEHVSIYRTAEIVEHQGDLYFGANDGVHGFELWKIDRPAGDTNFDGEIDLEDLNNVRNHFGGTGLGDADGDGDVDLDDLNAVRNHFGGAPAPVVGTNQSPTRSKDASNASWNRAVDLLFAVDRTHGEQARLGIHGLKARKPVRG